MGNSKLAIGRPDASEFSDYQIGYVDKVTGSDIMSFLQTQLDSMISLLSGLDESKANYKYAPDKWSVKELVGHMTDSERVFAYRALTFARNDATALPGFDQDPWVKQANHSLVPFQDLLDEFTHVRRSTVRLFGNLDADAWMRSGTANNRRITVRALAYVIAGHAQHHLEILKSRYLG